MPILGIVASSKATTAADTGAMFPIQSIPVGSAGATNVTFTNIPSTYTHLQIRAIGRTTASDADGTGLAITINSDTGSNYSEHRLIGTGSAATAGGGGSSTVTYAYRFASASQTASAFGAIVIDILDYANTNKYKTIRGFGGYDDNSTGRIAFYSGAWFSTSAITTIKIAPNSGNFAEYSQFTLYGIKGA